MTRFALIFAVLGAVASPAMAFPTGIEVPTLTWPDPVVNQSCGDLATVSFANCRAR